MIAAILTLLGVLVVAGISIAFVIRNLYYICEPNEVLIFSGPERHFADGRRVGYRLIKGGSGIRIPLFERVSRMDLTNIIIDLRVHNAYSKGGIPLHVEGVANLKIAGEEPVIHNAIERLLGKPRGEVKSIAKETLEGNLRGVLATLTPEQVNEDKIAFARSLLAEAEEDLSQLGLELDTLQVQNISDDVKYLDSIGRRKSAELQRDARIAEAEAKGEAAKIVEEGKARVEGLQRLIHSWQEAGASAREIFILQKLEPLLQILVETVPPIEVGGITVIAAETGGPATKSAAFIEQLRQASGLDIGGAIRALRRPGEDGPATEDV
jgi:flotillin